MLIIRWSRLLGGRQQRAPGKLRIAFILISLFNGAVVGGLYGSPYGAVWGLIILALLLFLEGL